jgi:shikimate kinase
MSNLRVHSRIYVVGFMGSGKTRRGEEMASLLNYQFVDLDQLVEVAAGKTIPQILADSGEHAFRALEQEQLKTTALFDRCIIATGGGTPCLPGAMEWMNLQGWTAWIKADLPTMIQRIANDPNRPLAFKKTAEELQALYEQRLPFYKKARQIFL